MSRALAAALVSGLIAACGGPPEPETTVPPIPIGIATLCGNRQVTISWTAMTGATSYDIYRSTASGTAGAWIGSASGTSFVDDNGLAGTTYYYTVKAVNSAGQSGASAQAAEVFCRVMGGALQGKALSIAALSATVDTFAGVSTVPGFLDGIGAAARFNGPQGMTTDGTFVYVADVNNNAIRRIDPATQEVILFAGSPFGASGSADLVGTAATFFGPSDLTNDGANLYVVDSGNCTIRRIVIATAAVITLAGTPASCASVNGSGTAANFSHPQGITTDGNSLFVTESTAVRRIDIASQLVTTFAGSGTAGHVDGIGSAARFKSLRGITTDGVSLFAVDDVSMDVRKIDIASATVTTYAGKPGIASSVDGTGTGATFNRPAGISSDGTNLYVVEQAGDVLRKVVIASATVTTLAGFPATAGTTDGLGSAARFNAPQGVTVYCGSLFVGDSGNNSIREIQ
jgi:hypothetical protein